MGNFDDREIGVESNTTTISRRFVIIAFPGVNLLDVAGPSEVFSSLAEVTGGDQAAVGYTIELASTTRDLRVTTSGGVALVADRFGSTPARFVERLRVDAVRRRLEETDGGLDRIARECGFGSDDAMRRSFLRVYRVALSDYRDRFRAAPSV